MFRPGKSFTSEVDNVGAVDAFDGLNQEWIGWGEEVHSGLWLCFSCASVVGIQHAVRDGDFIGLLKADRTKMGWNWGWWNEHLCRR